MKQHQGSSLILVLVVIASIMTVVLGTQRVSLVQFAQSNREEDSLFALYAAKAGIEDGLARFRHYRDVETKLNHVFRFDLNSGVAQYGTVVVGPDDHEVPKYIPIQAFASVAGPAGSYKPAHQYYDLGIDFKSTRIGVFIPLDLGGGPSPTSPILTRDSAFQLTGFDKTLSYYLRYGFKFFNPPGGGSCDAASVQLQAIGENGTILSQVNAAPDLGDIYDSASRANLPINTGVAGVSFVRIRPYGCDVRMAFIAVDSSGIPNGIRIDGLMNSDNTKFITRLTSTGYFGQAKRTLIGEIDRTSGQLLGIYDFNAYAGGNIKRQ